METKTELEKITNDYGDVTLEDVEKNKELVYVDDRAEMFWLKNNNCQVRQVLTGFSKTKGRFYPAFCGLAVSLTDYQKMKSDKTFIAQLEKKEKKLAKEIVRNLLNSSLEQIKKRERKETSKIHLKKIFAEDEKLIALLLNENICGSTDLTTLKAIKDVEFLATRGLYSAGKGLRKYLRDEYNLECIC